MDKDNNKKKYRLIKPFIEFKRIQKNLTNDKQLKDGCISSYRRFCKSSTSVPVERGGNKSRPQQDVYSFFLKPEEESKKNNILFFKSGIYNTSKPVLPYFKSVYFNSAPLSTLIPGSGKANMHSSELKNKFINLLMRDGEKSKAYKLFANSLKQIEYPRLENKRPTKRKVFDFFVARKNESYQKEEEEKKDKEKKSLFFSLGEKEERDYINVFLRNNILYQAVENVKPPLELRRVRKGGTTYKVPAIVSQKRQERLAIKWIIEAAEKKKKKNNKSFSDCLVSEITDAFNKTGQPRQRRDEQLKVAEFNRAYTLYRWW